MVGRTTARSSASRDQASSPTKPPGKRVIKPGSPTKPMGRTTRSASRELGEPELDVRARKTKRSRAAREGSADSVGSTASAGGKGGRKRKSARIRPGIPEELSMVEEEHEGEPANDGTKTTQSPGGMSNLSGTTALTSQSEQKMADLDIGMIVELIPDLLREAFQIMDLLAPSKASPEFVETVIKELQVPGSGRGKRLRLRERTFDSTKENYGTDFLIDPVLVSRKIFGDHDPGAGDSRPDVIIHAANIAVFVKELLVAQRDNPSTMLLLQRVDDVFPMPFLSGFEADPKFGSSALLETTFKLALDLRTQTSVAILKVYQDEMNFDPDELLAALFYDPPAQRNESLTCYEDLVKNGQCREMGGISAEALPLSERQVPDHQADEILERVELIREAFNVEGNGIIDAVDFDKLHERFPWNEFLTSIVQWSQLRLAEINKNIDKQGGVENITQLLVEIVKDSNSQVELYYEPPKPSQLLPEVAKIKSSLLPAATIIPASAGKSLYNSPRALLALFRKTIPGSSAPPSNQQHPAAPLPRSAEAQTSRAQKSAGRVPAAVPEAAAIVMDEKVQEDDDAVSDGDEMSIQEVLSLHYEGETYNHKENRPVLPEVDPNIRKKRFVDPQPNAERVTWSQYPDESEVEAHTTSQAKRRHEAVENDVEEDDGAFEIDSRPADWTRRMQAVSSATKHRTQTRHPQPTPKRPRIEYHEDTDEEPVVVNIGKREDRRREERQREQESSLELQVAATQDDGPSQRTVQDLALQSSAQAADDTPSSSYLFVQETARAAMLKYRPQSAPQQRQRWSINETETLINLIDRYGCSWVKILTEGGDAFAERRDQVALKDKARNIKVELLIAGAVLPRNFNGVALGKKEKEKVRANRMNPYRLEGELVGEEMYDENGILVSDDSE